MPEAQTPLSDDNPRLGDIARMRPSSEQVFIPPVPHVPMPDEVALRMPELKAWYNRFHDELDRWRIQTAHMLSNKE
jgi:hypothetical protein